jgi:hypothetical protein
MASWVVLKIGSVAKNRYLAKIIGVVFNLVFGTSTKSANIANGCGIDNEISIIEII